MGNEHTVDYHPSPSELTSRIHPLTFLWTPKGFISAEYFFLKSYFAKDVFLEILFCVILQGIQTFFGPGTPRISSGAWTSFKFMVLRLLEETFVRQKLNLFIFAHSPKQNSPPGRRKLPISPNSIFWKSVFSPSGRGKDYEAEKMTKIKLARILVLSFNKFHHLCSLYIFDFCFVVP